LAAYPAVSASPKGFGLLFLSGHLMAKTALGIALAFSVIVHAIDNGIGLTPPRGWRSWNLFHDKVNDTVMRAQMVAVLDKSRMVDGQPTSLASLGFDWVSMDDGWQKCNCSTSGSLDPSLPKCPNCKATGGCSWHDEKNGGKPVVDVRKFPDMKAMVDYGHKLGLKVGSYLNNCICMEGGDPPMGAHCMSPTHYQQDVDYIIEMGFDGVKIDNCGSSHNVTTWAALFNKTGKPIRIESCHTYHPNHHTPSAWPNFPVWDPPTHAKDAKCPMNLYRTGGDIRASFGSVMAELYATVQYSDHTINGKADPFNHPGCW
jgi:alpha-galactosidase